MNYTIGRFIQEHNKSEKPAWCHCASCALELASVGRRSFSTLRLTVPNKVSTCCKICSGLRNPTLKPIVFLMTTDSILIYLASIRETKTYFNHNIVSFLTLYNAFYTFKFNDVSIHSPFIY